MTSDFKTLQWSDDLHAILISESLIYDMPTLVSILETEGSHKDTAFSNEESFFVFCIRCQDIPTSP